MSPSSMTSTSRSTASSPRSTHRGRSAQRTGRRRWRGLALLLTVPGLVGLAGGAADARQPDATESYVVVMAADPVVAYEGDEPLITPETRASAESLAWADGLLFCYPTVMFMVPTLVKGWLDRVLVPGVAFVFDDNNKVRAGMTNIKRLGVVTTTPHTAAQTRRARDLGRRTIMWTLRLNCHRVCLRTWISLPAGTNDLTPIEAALTRW